MELKDFIGKVVVNTSTKTRYVLERIPAPCIEGSTVATDPKGRHTFCCWPTINGDPVSTGVLVFEDPSLTEPFKAAYEAYCHTRDAYWEEYGYWMRRD